MVFLLDPEGAQMNAARAVVAAIVTLAVTAVATPRTGEPATVALSGPEAAGILTTLFANLEEAHPDLYRSRGRAAVQADIAAAERGFGQRVSRVEFFRAAAPIVASLGDGHTSLSPNLPEYATFRAGAELFPLELRILDGRAVVVGDCGERGRIANGATVTAVNAIPMHEVLLRLGRYVSADSDAARWSHVTDDLGALLWIEGVRAPYTIRYRVPGSAEQYDATLPGTTFERRAAWAASSDAARLRGHALRFVDENRVAIVVLHDFGDDEVEWVRDVFTQVAAAGARSLVIDLRWNAGGTTEVGNEFLRHISRSAYRQISLERAKISGSGTVVTSEPGTTQDYADDPFAGSVYVLVGSGTLSAAAMFAAAAQDQHLATIAGEASGGNATLFGEPVDFTVPKFGLDVSVATKFFVRPAGLAAPRMVVPDLPLEETTQLDPDPELAAVVRRADPR